MKRHAYRGTSFDIPANKKFWKQCGEYDSLIQFEECCHRALIERYNEEKGKDHSLSFKLFTNKIATGTKVNLGFFDFDNYENSLYASYIIYPYGAFDCFIQDIIKDLKDLLINIKIDKYKGKGTKRKGTKLSQLLKQLKKRGIDVRIEQFKIDLFEYYRLRRNSVAHMLPETTYISSFNKSVKSRHLVSKTYPNQPNALTSYDKMTFDDFVVCTANLKNISDIITRTIEKNINWDKIGKSHPYWINYKKINAICSFEKQKKIDFVRKVIEVRYGVELSDELCESFL